jgi:Holliday junction resolvase RusA-like endonuclease
MKPIGQPRPRFARVGNHVRTYSTKKQQYAEQMIRAAWVEAGEPTLERGPVALTLTAFMQRPAGHFRQNMMLTAEGKRHPYPAKKPDLSNIVKLVEDALNGCAWADDALIIDITARKRWAFEQQPPHIHIHATVL